MYKHLCCIVIRIKNSKIVTHAAGRVVGLGEEEEMGEEEAVVAAAVAAHDAGSGGGARGG